MVVFVTNVLSTVSTKYGERCVRIFIHHYSVQIVLETLPSVMRQEKKSVRLEEGRHDYAEIIGLYVENPK